jgi:hypothetical protein
MSENQQNNVESSKPTTLLKSKIQRTRKIMLRLTIDEMEMISDANPSKIATATFIRDWLLKQSEATTPKVSHREVISFVVEEFVVPKLTFEEVLVNFDAYVLGKEEIKSEFHEETAAATREKHILLRFTDEEFEKIHRLIPTDTPPSVAIRTLLVEQLQNSTIPIPELVAFLVSSLHLPANFDQVLEHFSSGPLPRKEAINEVNKV